MHIAASDFNRLSQYASCLVTQNSPFLPKRKSFTYWYNGIVQVKAVDADGGLNGRVRYTLSKDVSPSLIYVHERTGVLRLSSSLDREATSRIEFTVWATDSGDDPKSASAEVCASYIHACAYSCITIGVFTGATGVPVPPLFGLGLPYPTFQVTCKEFATCEIKLH